jgi:ComF family protein
LSAARRIPEFLFTLCFPDDCRLCGLPLTNLSRIPVCPSCLKLPAPLVAECFCAVCNTPFLNTFPLDNSGRCTLCRLGVTRFDAAFSYGEYDGALRKLIHLFKYGKVQTLEGPLGKLLWAALPRDLRFDGVVAMPLHWRRRWSRGFNQSGLLAREVSRRASVPFLDCMKRTKATRAQAGLSNAQRRSNVAGAFSVKRGSRALIEDRHLLLVDDVMTTGATANACAAVLKRAGAGRVSILTLARVDRRFQAGRSVQYDASESVCPQEPT